MTTASQPDDFTDVFARDEPSTSSDRDRGADSAAPVDEGARRDERGRFAARDPEPEASRPETQAQQPAPKAETTPPPTTEADQARQPRHVPLPELLSEREKRQQEARLREEAERRARDLESRVAEYERLIQQQRQQQVQEQAPDPWSDPKGALEWQQQQMTRQLQQQQAQFQQQLLLERSNISEVRAREKWGDEVVTAAEQAAINAGYAAYFLQQRDPYAALMKWHRSSTYMSKVGDDPDKYEKEIEKRAYEKALADLRAGKAPGSSAASQRFPGSLADATSSSNGVGAVLTDEAAIADVFRR